MVDSMPSIDQQREWSKNWVKTIPQSTALKKPRSSQSSNSHFGNGTDSMIME